VGEAVTANLSSYDVRRIILEQAKRADVGHIGSALSIVEILIALYGHVMRVSDPDDPDRDRFILSKGHGALALYAVLHLKSWLKTGQIETYCADESALGVHPDSELKGIDYSTGSLGQGLSVALGIAIGAHIRGSNYQTYALLSDAECNEGSTWEAVMLATQKRVCGLTVIIDMNGRQALGPTSQILDMTNMEERWQSFGWDATSVDGHDISALCKAIAGDAHSDGPRVVLARTTFGSGVSFMQNQLAWHYQPMSASDFDIAMSEIERLEQGRCGD
jgi:transketolase